MKKWLFFIFVVSLISVFRIEAENTAFSKKVSYDFNKNDPVDVIIPCTAKDISTLELCIKGIRENCKEVRRVIVISNSRLTQNAEWFDEKNFPFDKQSVALYLVGGDPIRAKEYLSVPQPRIGWYLQQLLKLYAPFVIPNISSNVLHLDSDTIFLNPVSFLSESGGGLYNPGSEYTIAYFTHMAKLLPGLARIFRDYSGISHHMLLQRSALEDLFEHIESHHKMDLWKAYCICVDKADLFGSGCASDEVYFNFVFSRTDQVAIRKLKWDNMPKLSCIPKCKKEGYHYISCHSWMRED